MRSYDTIVIGAGMAGLCVARELAKLGEKVLVLEQDSKGGNSSRAAAGIIDPYTEASEETPLFRLALAAFKCYEGFLRGLGPRAKDRVEFKKTGALYLSFSEEDEKFLKSRFVWQRRREIPAEWLSAEAVLKKEPAVSPRVRSGIFYPEIPKLNADQLTGLCLKAAVRQRISLRREVEDIRVECRGKKVQGVSIRGEKFESRSVVVAAGSLSGAGPYLGVRVKVEPVRGQILILRPPPSRSPQTILHSLRYAYIIPWPRNRVLVGSTLESAGFNDRVTREGKEDILRRAGEIMEGIDSFSVERSWAGLRPFPERGRAFVGPTRIAGLFLATGYYRSGILIAPLVGKLLAEGIHSGIFSPLLLPFFLE